MSTGTDTIKLHYIVLGDDFTQAGESSSDLKKRLKKLGITPDAIRKIAIALYEGEINLVIHAGGGEIFVEILQDTVKMKLVDKGKGIADVELAMRVGYTTATEEVRNLGFGAGMGLPNMKKYTDRFEIESALGKGTTVSMEVDI